MGRKVCGQGTPRLREGLLAMCKHLRSLWDVLQARLGCSRVAGSMKMRDSAAPGGAWLRSLWVGLQLGKWGPSAAIADSAAHDTRVF